MLYCPQCRGEFVDGIEKCKKCNCDLITYDELLPFCNACNNNYPIGTEVCPNCQIKTKVSNIQIIEEDTEKSELTYVDLVTVYEAANESELAMVKGALETNGIHYYAKGESIVAIEGLGSVGGFNPLFGPIRVQVAKDEEEKSKEIIKQILGL